MGQYYIAANIDKRESITINGRYPGMKLLEIAEGTIESRAIINMIAGPWKGDRVYLAGDYADLQQKHAGYYKVLSKLTDELHLTETSGGIYKLADNEFAKIEADTEDHGYRFIYNHDKKQYIDICHCPKCGIENEWCQGYISPLPILIAMGNGLGGGDYCNSENDELAGTWCDSIQSVEITVLPKDDYGYEEWHPDFAYIYRNPILPPLW